MINIEYLEWSLYLKKKKTLIEYGIKNDLVKSYSDNDITNLRDVYCDGIPASIILLSNFLCSGFCYDRAMLITLGFSDSNFKIIDANIDGITLNPKYSSKYKDKNKTNHRFIEKIDKDGNTYVYDTSLGLLIEKKLYYEMENPQIIKTYTKEDLLMDINYQKMDNNRRCFNKSKLLNIIPQIELMNEISNSRYKDKLRKEIEIFKNSGKIKFMNK